MDPPSSVAVMTRLTLAKLAGRRSLTTDATQIEKLWCRGEGLHE
jgi:hypothetical protein